MWALFFLTVSTNVLHSSYSCVFHVTMFPPIALLCLLLYRLHTTPNFLICSAEGLTLTHTWAFSVKNVFLWPSLPVFLTVSLVNQIIGRENEGNDHQLRKLLIVKWILLVNTLKIGVEQYGEYAYWCQEVRLGYNNNKIWSKFANQIIHENYQITSSPRFLWKSTGLTLQPSRLQDLNWI